MQLDEVFRVLVEALKDGIPSVALQEELDSAIRLHAQISRQDLKAMETTHVI